MSPTTFRKTRVFRFIALTVLTAFAAMLPAQPSFAQVAIVMPPPGQMIHITRHFEPPQMVGLRVDLKDPFNFEFIMDQGESPMSDDVSKQEYNKIIKYFLVSLTMPNKDMWVNLSPYESQRIIPQIFAQTEMGRDLLAQDYILKQFTASLMYPENGLGKAFWAKVYNQAQARFGTTDISVNTFNKVWIVADHADVYQKGDAAFLMGSHLKVMLEQDYMAIEKHKEMFGTAQPVATDENMDAKTKMASDIVRQIIIPAIEKEVNEGKSFAAVRQVYNAEIMATWFKKTLRESLLGQVFANKAKISGQKVNDPKAMEKIYQQYLKAYKVGVFNYIREDATPDGQTIPRKYFSGGAEAVQMAMVTNVTDDMIASSLQFRQEKSQLVSRLLGRLGLSKLVAVWTAVITLAGFGFASKAKAQEAPLPTPASEEATAAPTVKIVDGKQYTLFNKEKGEWRLDGTIKKGKLHPASNFARKVLYTFDVHGKLQKENSFLRRTRAELKRDLLLPKTKREKAALLANKEVKQANTQQKKAAIEQKKAAAEKLQAAAEQREEAAAKAPKLAPRKSDKIRTELGADIIKINGFIKGHDVIGTRVGETVLDSSGNMYVWTQLSTNNFGWVDAQYGVQWKINGTEKHGFTLTEVRTKSGVVKRVVKREVNFVKKAAVNSINTVAFYPVLNEPGTKKAEAKLAATSAQLEAAQDLVKDLVKKQPDLIQKAVDAAVTKTKGEDAQARETAVKEATAAADKNIEELKAKLAESQKLAAEKEQAAKDLQDQLTTLKASKEAEAKKALEEKKKLGEENKTLKATPNPTDATKQTIMTNKQKMKAAQALADDLSNGVIKQAKQALKWIKDNEQKPKDIQKQHDKLAAAVDTQISLWSQYKWWIIGAGAALLAIMSPKALRAYAKRRNIKSLAKIQAELTANQNAINALLPAEVAAKLPDLEKKKNKLAATQADLQAKLAPKLTPADRKQLKIDLAKANDDIDKKKAEIAPIAQTIKNYEDQQITPPVAPNLPIPKADYDDAVLRKEAKDKELLALADKKAQLLQKQAYDIYKTAPFSFGFGSAKIDLKGAQKYARELSVDPEIAKLEKKREAEETAAAALPPGPAKTAAAALVADILDQIRYWTKFIEDPSLVNAAMSNSFEERLIKLQSFVPGANVAAIREHSSPALLPAPTPLAQNQPVPPVIAKEPAKPAEPANKQPAAQTTPPVSTPPANAALPTADQIVAILTNLGQLRAAQEKILLDQNTALGQVETESVEAITKGISAEGLKKIQVREDAIRARVQYYTKLIEYIKLAEGGYEAQKTANVFPPLVFVKLQRIAREHKTYETFEATVDAEIQKVMNPKPAPLPANGISSEQLTEIIKQLGGLRVIQEQELKTEQANLQTAEQAASDPEFKGDLTEAFKKVRRLRDQVEYLNAYLRYIDARIEAVKAEAEGKKVSGKAAQEIFLAESEYDTLKGLVDAVVKNAKPSAPVIPPEEYKAKLAKLEPFIGAKQGELQAAITALGSAEEAERKATESDDIDQLVKKTNAARTKFNSLGELITYAQARAEELKALAEGKSVPLGLHITFKRFQAKYKNVVDHVVVNKAQSNIVNRHTDKLGGINLSDENLVINIKVDGAGMPLPARFQNKAMLNLNGLRSIIRRISPLTPQNVPELFELVK